MSSSGVYDTDISFTYFILVSLVKEFLLVMFPMDAHSMWAVDPGGVLVCQYSWSAAINIASFSSWAAGVMALCCQLKCSSSLQVGALATLSMMSNTAAEV